MVQLTPEASDRIANAVCNLITQASPPLFHAIDAWTDAAKRITRFFGNGGEGSLIDAITKAGK